MTEEKRFCFYCEEEVEEIIEPTKTYGRGEQGKYKHKVNVDAIHCDHTQLKGEETRTLAELEAEA
jgi:D-arabinose 1-dehydrogenase-like Zn-dependent alcohol dehydrogenase